MIKPISVTQKEIDNGFKSICYACPIALAITNCIGEYSEWRVEISFNKVFFIKKGKVQDDKDSRYLPLEAEKFIVDFDRGIPVEPFSFNLDVPL